MTYHHTKKKKEEAIFRDTILNLTEWSGDIGGRCIQLLASLVQRRAGGYRGPGCSPHLQPLGQHKPSLAARQWVTEEGS